VAHQSEQGLWSELDLAGDNAMTTNITGADSEHLLDEGWSTPLEAVTVAVLRARLGTADGRA
jgi:hypothetical protein